MRRLLVLVVALGLGLVACGGSGSGGDAAAPVRAGDLLDFTLPAVGGGEVRGEDYSGKALALWFWAPW